MTTPVSRPSRRATESLMAEFVENLPAAGSGLLASHFAFSRLQPFNRRPAQLDAAVRGVKALTGTPGTLFFQFPSEDVLIVYPTDVRPVVMSEMRKIRILFAEDPLFGKGADRDALISHFDLDHDPQGFAACVAALRQETPPGRAGARHRGAGTEGPVPGTGAPVPVRGRPLTPELLSRVEGALAQVDLSALLRRHSACSFLSGSLPVHLFTELTISIEDLSAAIDKTLDMMANGWLFQHLTETLDLRMLAILGHADGIDLSGDISLNMNIGTILSPAFAAFDDGLMASRRGRILLEISPFDVFHDLDRWFFARRMMVRRGYRTCLDGLNAPALALLNPDRLLFDHYKLSFDSRLPSGGDGEQPWLARMVDRFGPSRLILARVETRRALDLGRSAGVALFQGRLINGLVAADPRRDGFMPLNGDIASGT